MLTEIQLERYADILFWALDTARKKKFKKNDIVLIRYQLPALRLAEILNARLLKMGMHPVQRLMPTAVMEKNFYQLSNSRQLEFTAPGEKALYQSLNGSIFLYDAINFIFSSFIQSALVEIERPTMSGCEKIASS